MMVLNSHHLVLCLARYHPGWGHEGCRSAVATRRVLHPPHRLHRNGWESGDVGGCGCVSGCGSNRSRRRGEDVHPQRPMWCILLLPFGLQQIQYSSLLSAKAGELCLQPDSRISIGPPHTQLPRRQHDPRWGGLPRDVPVWGWPCLRGGNLPGGRK